LIGSYIGGVSVLVFLVMLAKAFSRKGRTGANPWGAGGMTLE
jgi:heme/copper-type cytochrome/quinol oxidase subunit 1